MNGVLTHDFEEGTPIPVPRDKGIFGRDTHLLPHVVSARGVQHPWTADKEKLTLPAVCLDVREMQSEPRSFCHSLLPPGGATLAVVSAKFTSQLLFFSFYYLVRNHGVFL